MTDISKEPAEKSPEVAGNRPLAGALDSAASNSTVADLYLLCYIPSPLFHAHWALFVPDQADPQRGTVINIRGDPLNGFDHEIQRDYVPSEDPDKPPFMTKLGSLEDTLVVRPHRSLEAGKDAVAYTDLERLALSIPAPGPSLGRSRASTGVSLHSRLEPRHQYIS